VSPTGPEVSVVAVTRDRRSEVLHVLPRLRSLPEQPPVLLVDNASSDGTADAVRAAHPDVEVLELGENHGAAGRTAGVLRASTPCVAFSDDDSWWAPGALECAVRLLSAHPDVAVVAARVLVGPEERLDPVCVEMADSPLGVVPEVGPAVLGFVACGAVVRREAYLAVGGFHERFGVGGEESLLAIDLARRGWSCAYVDDLVALHHPSPVRDLRARRAREVRNELWTLWLRRPPGTVARGTGRVLRRLREPAVRQGLRQAVAGLPWVLRERAVVPVALERQLRLLR
jgi:GT2 family glycosyltransferase